MAMLITGMTVSLEFKQSTYGGEAAENLYINLQARVPDDEPGVTMEEALEQSLDLHLTAYESLLSSRLAAKAIRADIFNQKIASLRTRFSKLKTLLKEEQNVPVI